MRYRFHHIEKAPRDRVEDHVREKAGLIESRLATFQDDLVLLDVRLDYREKRYANRQSTSNYDGRLVLYLPGQNLPNIGVIGHGEFWVTALNEAFDDLEDQLDKLLAKLHREPDIRNFQRRPPAVHEEAGLPGETQTELEDLERLMEGWERN